MSNDPGPERSPDREAEGPDRRAESEGRDGVHAGGESREGQASPPAEAGDDGSPGRLLANLHQTHGNAFVQRMLAERSRTVQRVGGEHAEAEHLKATRGLGRGAVDWPQVSSAAISGTTSAIAVWKAMTSLTGVVVNAVTASGGKLVGPPLSPLIMPSMLGTGVPARIVVAFAMGAGQAWDEWASSVTVPGLPWYPSFAAVPSSVAPPAPNIPTPLAALTGKRLTAGAVGAAITKMLPPTKDPGQDAAVIDFAAWFAETFRNMLQTTMVVNVLGTGPVPTFAPPYVPVGPVIGGSANSAPGCLIGTAPAPPRG